MKVIMTDVAGSHIKEIREDKDRYYDCIFIILEDGRVLCLSTDDETSCISSQVYQSWKLAMIDNYGTGPERKAAGFI